MFPLDEDRLKSLPFIDYLKFMEGRVNGVYHRKKSDTAYHEARELSRHLILRYVQETKQTWQDYGRKGPGMHFMLDQDILEKYEHKGSDTRKEDVITEWRKDLSYDLSMYIGALERAAIEAPETPLQDHEF